MRDRSTVIEGRNPVIEALRADRSVEKVFVQQGLSDGPIETIIRTARKAGAVIEFVPKQRLDEISETGHHQGVICYVSEIRYAEVDDILAAAAAKGEDPFIILLDGIEDPYNVGAIIRTADIAGAHGVIIPKRRSAGITAGALRSSAGAVNYVPVAMVTNMNRTIEDLKQKGLWFVCADMNGTAMYDLDLKGPIGLVIGNEGSGVSALVKKNCDMTASIPMQGHVGSLNASVAAGILSYEIVRQRLGR